PERVRTYLQSTAKLQFFELYSNEELIENLQPANDALAAFLSGEEEPDTAAATIAAADTTTETDANDTTSLASLLGASTTDSTGLADTGAASQAEARKKNPLFAVWYPNITQEGNVNNGPVIGMVSKRDTAKL